MNKILFHTKSFEPAERSCAVSNSQSQTSIIDDKSPPLHANQLLIHECHKNLLDKRAFVSLSKKCRPFRTLSVTNRCVG